MLVTWINLAYTRNSYELLRKIKQLKMGKSQKLKRKRLTVHLTSLFWRKANENTIATFHLQNAPDLRHRKYQIWWPVKKWVLCCKAGGKGRLAAIWESNPLCCPQWNPDTAHSPRSTFWCPHTCPESYTQGQSPRNCLQMLKTVGQGNLYSLNRFSKTHVSKKAKTQCTFYVEKSLTLIMSSPTGTYGYKCIQNLKG